MNCPHCNEELKLSGETRKANIELRNNASINGSVTIVLICAECFEELGEYDIELELDITDFSRDHEDEVKHKLTIELLGECFDAHSDDDGIVYPGASAAINVSCICGVSVEYSWSNYAYTDDVIRKLNI